MDALLFVVEQEGRGRLPHRRAHLLLPRVRERRRARARVSRPEREPSLDEFVALARDYTVVPVWREVLADLETPVSAFVKLVGDREGFLLESVEHGEHWGRFSFIGRDPRSRSSRAGNTCEISGGAARPACPPTEGSARRARSAARPGTGRRRLAELPPFHGGVVGYLGYDVVREIERLPDVPSDDLGWPDAVLSLTGHVTAFDHFRQRLFLIENVFVAPGADAEDARRGVRPRAKPGSTRLVDELARPLPYVPSPPPAGRSSTSCRRSRRRCQAVCSRRAVEAAQGVHLRRRHLPGRARAALRSRRRLRSVRGVSRAAADQPVAVHVLPAHPEATVVGSSPEALVQLRRRPSDQPSDRGHAVAGPHRRARPSHGRRADRGPEGASRARHAGRPRPQRRRPGRAVRQRAASRSS